MEPMRGVYLPLVTPFHDGDVDIESLQKLVTYYASTRVSGLIMLGTTGESPTVEPDEQQMIVEATLEVAGGALPVYVGVSGLATSWPRPTTTDRRPMALSLTTSPLTVRPTGRSSSTTSPTGPG